MKVKLIKCNICGDMIDHGILSILNHYDEFHPK